MDLEPTEIKMKPSEIFEFLHQVAYSDEKGVSAAISECYWKFGSQACYHLIGILEKARINGTADIPWSSPEMIGSLASKIRKHEIDDIFKGEKHKIQSLEIKKATWESIKDSAKNIFNYYTDGYDLEWAKTAWRIIEKTSLSDYSDDKEYQLILIRLLALAELYGLYNMIAHEERYEHYEQYEEWSYEIDVNKFLVASLAGEKYHSHEYIEEDGICEPIDILLEKEYYKVIEVLLEGFGGYDNLMISLQKSSGGWDEDSHLSIEDIELRGIDVSDIRISSDTFMLFEWKESGFCRKPF